MEEDKEESSKKKLRQEDSPVTAAGLFTDDLILEVLSRLPARSVCRFKCVSTPWRDLIADPVNRKKLPQTLAGFLYTTCGRSSPWDISHHFASVSGGAAPVDASLPFLQPNKYKYIAHVDTCNGLLLCACFSKETPAADNDEFRYVVCNPATERWIELPPIPQAWATRIHSATRLAFDPKMSSHFHVLEFDQDVGSYVTGADIFSSQTGAWIRRDCGLVEKIQVFHGITSVFFGGMLHLVGRLNLNPISTDEGSALLVVDMKGKAWKTIRLPNGFSNCAIGLSRGCLYYASTTRAHVRNNNNEKTNVRATDITLWCLENYDSKEWVLKHSASIDEPLGITGVRWRVFAIHPDCLTIFLVPWGGDVLASYNVQHQKFAHILNVGKDKNSDISTLCSSVLRGISRCRWALKPPLCFL